jgi:hypothetical protein
MWKIDATINQFTFKSHPLQVASMAKRMRLFSGAEGLAAGEFSIIFL